MTPFDLVLGERGPVWLLGAVIVAALLTAIAAGLEIALERAGGPDPGAAPDWFAERGPALFVLGGVPAILLATGVAIVLTLALGGNPEDSGLPVAIGLLVNLAVFVAIVCIGLGSPLAQHWGLGIAVFGAGISAMFPLLVIANALPFDDDGSLPYPDRIVFALVVGLILFSLTLAAAALLSLAVNAFRTARMLHTARRGARPSRLRVIGGPRGRG
jgi:lysylphosphatidylglycerol synthetase-like protein (DUF2156 family)